MYVFFIVLKLVIGYCKIIHGLTTFPFGIFGKEWEERKIKEYMEKDK
ncbi:2TM domain-containing protein [Bacillus cereus]|nr:2TM domain-containing protein [Bacillus cereus]